MPTTIRIPDELKDAIDAARGDVPRERWVRRACESALEVRAVVANEVALLHDAALHGTSLVDQDGKRVAPSRILGGSPSPSLDRFKEKP